MLGDDIISNISSSFYLVGNFIKEHMIILSILVIASIVSVLFWLVFTNRKGVKGTTTVDGAESGLNDQYWQSIRSQLSKQEAKRYEETIREANLLKAQCKELVNSRQKESISRVLTAAKKLRDHMDAEEKRLASNNDYKKCIAMHYASFTAANRIHETREQMKLLRDQAYSEKMRLDREISAMKVRQTSRFENSMQISEACRNHKKMHILLQEYSNAASSLYEMENNQNQQTIYYREYIRNNFGNRGKAWYSRLMKRKAAA